MSSFARGAITLSRWDSSSVWRYSLGVVKNGYVTACASESIDDSDAGAWEVYSRRREKDSVILADDFVTRLHTQPELLRLAEKIFEPAAKADPPSARNFREIRRRISEAGGKVRDEPPVRRRWT